jgi:hypothetical protein
MERVTDELISYIEQNALLAAARKAVNRRLKLEAHGDLSVVRDSRWRYVRCPWKDRAEDLYVEWIEIGYKIDCASVSEEDPDYVVVTNHGDGGTRTFEGTYGEYEVVIVYTKAGAFSISGCKALSLVKCAGSLGREDRVRFVYKGTVDVGHDNVMKDYELYVLR